LELVQAAGDRLSRRGDHLGEEVVREGELDPDAVWLDSPELARQLGELLANAIDVVDAGEVARCVLPLPERAPQAPDERGRRTRYRQQGLELGNGNNGDPAVRERL
jgi:hypothetical protein